MHGVKQMQNIESLHASDFMNDEQKEIGHSRLGIASTVFGILLWAFFLTMIILVTQTDLMNKLSTPMAGLKVDNLGLSGLLKGFLWLLVLFVIIPFVGHSTGLILGIIGAFQNQTKRTFPVSGVVLNGLYFLVLAVLTLAKR